VVATSSVDIPETMIERERELLLQQIRRYVEQNNQSWEDFSQRPEFEQMRNGKLEEAKQRVLTSLVLGAVVRAEAMSVTEEEMAPYFAELVARYNVPAEQVIRNEELRRQVMEEVLTNKVVYFLVNSADIKYVPEPEQPEHDHEHGPGCDHDHEAQPKAEGEEAEKAEKKKAQAKK
ncbi:MAG: hypothetical protein ACRD3W_01915, partial [Terriglobales bacterium]